MANRYWVGGTATWDGTAGTKWATTSGGSGGAAVPTAADDVFFDANSGAATVTIGAARVARSVVCTGFTGTLAGTGTMSIGTSSVNGTTALLLVAGMTYTHTGAITFVSTNGTTVDITSAGKTLPNLVFNGAGGSWRLVGTTTCGSITVTTGSFNTNNVTVNAASLQSNNSNTRSVTLGTSTITLSAAAAVAFNTTTNLTFSGASSTINMAATAVVFNGGGLTWGTVNFTGAGTVAITGANTFNSLVRWGTAAATNELYFDNNQTVATPMFIGNNAGANRLLVRSNILGTQRTITSTNAWTSCANVDFQDIAAAGSGSANISAITGNSGDAGGNSGFTFTAGALQTLSANTAGDWSTRAWSGRMPLPQDDWEITASFSGQTITIDSLRIGKSGTWAGSTGNVTWSFGASGTKSMYGSIALRSGVTIAGTPGLNLNSRSTGNTMTCGGATWTIPITVFGGTGVGNWLQTDDFTSTSSFALTSGFTTSGEWNTNGFNVTCATFSSGFGGVLTMNASTFFLTSTAAATVWSSLGIFSIIHAGTSNIVIANASSSNRTFAGGDSTYSQLTYTIGGSTGVLILSGNNTFGALNFSDTSNARNIRLTSGSTTTITSAAGVNWSGSSGNLTTVDTTTGGSAATVAVSSGTVSVNYVSLRDNTASGNVPFYAGANSVDVSGNTNWTFSSPPSNMGMLMMFN